MSFFSYFPRIRYNDKVALNLLLRVKVLDKVLSRRDIYYEYLIKEGEYPDTVADRFYGDPEYDWIVYLSNNITDPYRDWPLSYNDLKSYIEKKYNTTVFETKSLILFYKYTGLSSDSSEKIERNSYTMSTTTFENLSSEEKSGWTPVFAYDYEEELNDNKRNIRIVQPNFVNKMINEIQELLA